MNDAGSPGEPGCGVVIQHQRHSTGELGTLWGMTWVIGVSRGLLRVFQGQQQGIGSRRLQSHTACGQARACCPDGSTGRINALRDVRLWDRTMKINLAVKIGPGAIEFFVTLDSFFGLSDASQIEPSAQHVLKPAARLFERAL